MENKESRTYSQCSGAETKSNIPGPTPTVTPTTAGRKINLDKLNEKLKTGSSLASSVRSVSDSFKGVFGHHHSTPTPTTAPVYTTSPLPEAPKPGMGTGMKVAIGLGVATILGLGIYFWRKNK